MNVFIYVFFFALTHLRIGFASEIEAKRNENQDLDAARAKAHRQVEHPATLYALRFVSSTRVSTPTQKQSEEPLYE